MIGTRSTEQWISGGNCKLCRRQKYCSKPCALKKKKMAIEKNSIWNELNAVKKIKGVFNDGI